MTKFRRIGFLVCLLAFVIDMQASHVVIANQTIIAPFKDTIVGPGVTGFVYYDSETQTLTLKDATISHPTDPSEPLFFSYIPIQFDYLDDTVTIELVGENSIFSFGGMLLAGCNVVIKGGGALTVKAYGLGSGMWIGGTGRNVTLHIKNCTVNLDKQMYGDMLGNGVCVNSNTEYSTLIVDNAFLFIHSNRCIKDLSELQLHNAHIAFPEGASFNQEEGTVLDSEGNVCGDLEIRPGTVGVVDVNPSKLRVWGGLSRIVIENCLPGEKIELFNIIGQLQYTGHTKSEQETIMTKPGVYVIKVGNKTNKVIVF